MIRVSQPLTIRYIMNLARGPIHLRGHNCSPALIRTPQYIVDSNEIVYVRETPKYDDEHGHGQFMYPITTTTIAETDEQSYLWLRPQFSYVQKYGLVTNTGHMTDICRGGTRIMDLTRQEQGFQKLIKVNSYGYETSQNVDSPQVFNYWNDWNSTTYVLASKKGNLNLQFAIKEMQFKFTICHQTDENRCFDFENIRVAF